MTVERKFEILSSRLMHGKNWITVGDSVPSTHQEAALKYLDQLDFDQQGLCYSDFFDSKREELLDRTLTSGVLTAKEFFSGSDIKRVLELREALRGFSSHTLFPAFFF